jgi:hypothetical protein
MFLKNAKPPVKTRPVEIRSRNDEFFSTSEQHPLSRRRLHGDEIQYGDEPH